MISTPCDPEVLDRAQKEVAWYSGRCAELERELELERGVAGELILELETTIESLEAMG